MATRNQGQGLFLTGLEFLTGMGSRCSCIQQWLCLSMTICIVGWGFSSFTVRGFGTVCSVFSSGSSRWCIWSKAASVLQEPWLE